MNEIQIFKYGLLNEVRVIDRNKEPWFVAKDVCEILGLGNSRDAVSRLDDDEKDDVGISDAIGREQQTTVINEPGLYSLVLRSNKPEAKAFKRWITHDVIPAIRKTGGYVHAAPEDDDMAIMAKGLMAAQRAIELQKARLQEADRTIQELAPKAEYTEQVLAAGNLHTINSVAVFLGISAIRLNKFLVDEGWIYRQGDIYYPSCKIRDRGYCSFHVIPYLNRDGEKMTREHLKWTEAGRQAILELWQKKAA